MDYGCGAVSLTLPVLITAERLIAVFLPLRFHQIVTSRRTWTAVIVVSVFWYGFFIHMTFYVVLDFELDQSLNLTVGVMRRSVYHNQNPVAVETLEEVMSYLVMKIPPVLTFVGCIIIGVKIKMASRERQKLTSKGGKGELSTRTTKMLMAVCALYTVACSTLSLPTFIPQYMYYSITSDAPSNLGRILYQVMNIALCINSSSNFVIYVVMNKNFRSTYWSLFTKSSCLMGSASNDVNDTSGQSDMLLSEELTVFILQILIYGVTPGISCFGIAGNVLSILILRRHGLHKCSNILLISLALSDMMFLIGFNNVPKLLYDVVGDVEMYTYDYSTSFALYAMFHVFNILNYASLGVSLTLPSVITCERLTAVFLPLRFRRVFTPGRTWACVFLVYLFWYTFFTHMSFYRSLSFEFSPAVNMTVGLIKKSSYYFRNPRTVQHLEDAMSYLMMKIPAAATMIGCAVIWVRIRWVSIARRRLTRKASGSRDATGSHTTKILLAVCTVYTITCVVMSLPTFIPKYTYYTMTSDAPSNLSKIMYHLMNMAVCVNCSCNFVIYILMNQNFRDTYRAIVLACKNRPSGA
ncbi:hypothetical protein Btru_067442 [Bulinus truncatus]|nr:hypothetical protein Btru_067442 [Bulinus truncatus]